MWRLHKELQEKEGLRWQWPSTSMHSSRRFLLQIQLRCHDQYRATVVRQLS
jgi:hypothetical protein